jgi:chromosome partitioning protein
MHVMAFCSQKGGSGKTTLSGHVGVQADRAGGGPVALLDCDPQGSLAAWWNARKSDRPAFVKGTLATLQDDLEQLRSDGFRCVVIDTPPAVSPAILSVIALSDLVIIPTRPSPHDLRAVGATLDLAERARKPVVFVLNGAAAKARITADAAVALSQHGVVAPSFIHHRTAYVTAMIDGRTVMEVYPTSRATLEVQALWHYLAEHIQRLASRRVLASQAPREFGRRGIPLFTETFEPALVEVS